jgi:hypothetical protein
MSDDEPDRDAADADDLATLPGHPVAYAANWRTVLAVDAILGVALIVIGVVMAIAWNPFIGGFVGAVGAAYVGFIAKRAREWRGLRRAAGLER